MKSLVYVFLGGGLGSLFRFLLSKFITTSKNGFPWSTLFANFIGCLLIGILLGWAIKNNNLRSDLYLLLAVGFCGGLTTFSTLSLEGLSFLKAGDYTSFISYVVASVVGGIVFVALGHYLFRLTES
jgi:CrcB protein